MTCPYCSASPAPFAPNVGEVQTTGGGGSPRRWYPAACPACGGMIVAEIDGNNNIKAVYPKAIGQWDVAHLPDDVKHAWEEAVKVYGVGAFASAVVTCGRTLEAAADARGVTGRTLQERITKIQQQGLITTEFKGAINYARLIRNIGAHAGKPVTPQSAEGTMRFTQQTLRLLFEVPHELARLTGRPPELDEEPGESSSPPGAPAPS